MKTMMNIIHTVENNFTTYHYFVLTKIWEEKINQKWLFDNKINKGVTIKTKIKIKSNQIYWGGIFIGCKLVFTQMV